MSFSELTTYLQTFAQFIFISAGPYILMIALGVLVLMVAKGWAQMKTAVIAAVAAFCFFGIPALIHYAQQQASMSI
jgi:ABC-type transport system involved in Fe-S cluster assembly fused permease/ATPase subunit